MAALIGRREFITLLGCMAARRARAGNRTRAADWRADGRRRGRSGNEGAQAFRLGLEKRGWSERRNVHLDYRFTAGRAEPIPAFVKELVALQPDVILAHSTGAAAGVQRESRAIPIVFVNVSDPIGAGFIASMARPGGNLTGVLHLEATIVGKWLTMLKEIAPPSRWNGLPPGNHLIVQAAAVRG
jgi:putative tryptophan/tyrosine transport system substrate-binding protein